EAALPHYREAFRGYGLRVGETPYKEGAALIQGRPPEVRGPLVAALDDWYRLLWSQRDSGDEAQWVAMLLAWSDPDPWRVEGRFLGPRRERAKMVALARDPRAAGQPPQTLQLLGNLLRELGATREAVELFRSAQARHPGDFWLNHNLGIA